MKFLYIFFTSIILISCKPDANAQLIQGNLKADFTKQEVYIPMRDGVKLFTAIYTPKDASSTNTYPFLMERTPYSISPYGADNFPRRLGPNPQLQKEKFIFVYQDVRGRYKSGGNFEEMTPAIDKKKTGQTDESSDTYDTVDWLLKNIKGNNGKAGMYGISYPGFYASAALPNAHPALKAVSPQAPVTDEFMGDDANHNGAFFLLDNFSFMNYFGGERSADSTDYAAAFSAKRSSDAYQYFLQMGPLKNTQKADLYNHKVKIWNEYLQHYTYDDYWKARNIRTSLKNVKPAVLVVGGMFDAEDMFGAQRTYEAIEKQSPTNQNHIVLGPWSHGAWARGEWTKFGLYNFGRNINLDYQKIETAFFNYHLKNKGTDSLSEATVFFTGTNEWKPFAQWPPTNIKQATYHFSAGNTLTQQAADKASDSYTSDPANPVPYIAGIAGGRRNEYLADDQKFATQRSDVLTYFSEPLPENTTLAGRVHANLQVALEAVNGDSKALLDADFIVKIIDVTPDSGTTSTDIKTSGQQRLVRAEVFRGKFRNSFEKPEGFIPGKKTNVQFDLNDASHTFLKGHRLMVQVQSSWFPIVDRNPQKLMRIPDAEEKDFQPVKVTLYHDGSSISLPMLQGT